MEKIIKFDKVWGSEEWIVNRNYCGKILNLKKGHRCSIHYHKNKDETFYLLDGKVLLELDGKTIVMNKGDAQLIEPNQKHRFTGLKNSRLIEFSTHHEEEDSYRDAPSEKIKKEEFSKILEKFVK
jgi:quercetin dioxygenase-like cupin family protein